VGTFFTKNSDVISRKQTIVKSADTTQVINEGLEKEWHQNWSFLHTPQHCLCSVITFLIIIIIIIVAINGSEFRKYLLTCWLKSTSASYKPRSKNTNTNTNT